MLIKLIELFAGVGTQRKAFENICDCTTVAISEIDSRPLNIYTHLFSDCPNLGDITKIQSLPMADIWTYSFPCTDLSIAGNQKGLNGENSRLIYEVLRLLKSSPKPKILIMENVTNLVSAKFISGFNEWIDLLSQEGYITTWQKLKASEYGGYTIRNRVFAISVLAGPAFSFPKTIKNNNIIADILEPALPNYFVDNYPYKELPKNTKNTIKIADYNNGGQGNRIYSIHGKGVTLTATGGGKGGSSGLYLRPEGLYKLSDIEMIRAMGWTLEDAKIMQDCATYRDIGFCMGNGIDLIVLTHLAKSIIEQYFT